MVNRLVVSRWQDAEPPSEDQWKTEGGRRISEKQLYPTKNVLDILGNSASVVLWTRKCQLDVAARVWDETDVENLVRLAVERGKRHKPEWCENSPTGPIAACDVYSVFREETNPNSGNKMLMEYYVKFAIALSGTVLLIVSCHTTEK